MDVGETSSFLRLDPYKRNVVVARWEDALEKFTRWELSRIDACLATLVGKLDGELEAELHSARRLVFELYGDAYDDNKEDYGPWDGRTAPADLQELAEEEA
jgi:hypothetical protein